ncbi:MAG: sporulation protein YabP [Firmicutes bacterium HGW-Firmicutes-1]|nr:MAG: sporulation protein YabP [Firmicutes bacterium HGW-Firmicutes-1]
MEDRSYTNHRIVVTNRDEMSITGVSDVVSFDETLVVVETDMGMLEIKGEALHVNQLNLENGEMSLTGDIGGIEYDDKTAYKRGGKSIISRLFG